MIVDVRGWFRSYWPTMSSAVIADYASLRQHPHFLADLLLRGQVFGPCHVPGDAHTSAVNEGRRQLAVEIIKLAGEDPRRLFDLIEKSTSLAARDSARQSMS